MRRSILLVVVTVFITSATYAILAGPEPTPTSPATTSAPAATQAARQRVHVFVSGKVQGVGFRGFVQAQAVKLALTGFVRNLKDGRVELVAEGPARAIADLLAKVKQGPPAARVDKLETTDETPTGEFDKFQVK